MKGLRLPARLEAAFWEKSRGWRRRLRELLGRLSRRRQRRRGIAVPEPRAVELAPLPWPLVAAAGEPVGESPYYFHADTAAVPASLLESLLLAAAAEDLDLVEAGWAEPSRVAGLGPGAVAPLGPGGVFLIRRREPSDRQCLRGKVLPLLGAPGNRETEAVWPFFTASGAYRHPLGGEPARIYTPRVDLRLAAMPPEEGPPTVLFLLPFLAVGGAERLLFDLLASWRGFRVLIVTVEPHAAQLGQSVSRARELTPHVYTLGDWLPRETHLGALFHLLRRYRVQSLVSWNGTIFFYDSAPAIRGQFPQLRILSQLFHHQGGFFTRNGKAARAAIDGHLAVNRAIAGAIVDQLGEPPEKVHLLHHGVEVPPVEVPPVEVPPVEAPAAAPAVEQAGERARLRDELGLPADALVAGTFIRLHPQKRPLDVIELAHRFAGRRFAGRQVYFLLVGGGPLGAEIDAELAARPAPNLIRRPLIADARPLYPAIDLCLLTSSYEGLPIFLLDGLARGIPCVSTAVGEVPELLAQGGGRCVPAGDLDQLAAAIEDLLDPAKRAAEGRRGRRTIEEKFSLEPFAAAYRRVIFPGAGDEG